MRFYIRDARPEDAPALTWLNKVAMGYEYPEDKTAEKLALLLQKTGPKSKAPLEYVWFQARTGQAPMPFIDLSATREIKCS